jgi:hypothetical protein
MPSCHQPTALAMRLDRSCGKLNISLGKWVNFPRADSARHAATTDAVSLAVSTSNHIPWIIIGVCFVSCMVLLFSIRVLLVRENKRRDAEPRDDSYDDVYVERSDEKGNRVASEVKVSKVRVRSYWGAHTTRSYDHDSPNRSSWI